MTSTKHILVIEDNIGVAELISEKLHECGYTTQVAPSGREALSYLKDTKVDMVILDYSLPDMDGKEIISSVKAAEIVMPPFIVSTGRGDEQLAVDMMKLGAYDYLIKDKSLISRLPETLARLGHEIARDEELHKAQQALRESEERFRNFVEKASDFFVKLSVDGSIQYSSPNWQRHMGLTPDDISKITIFDLIHPEDKTSLEKQLQEAVRDENAHFAAEYRVQHKTGEWKYHAVKGYSVNENQSSFVNCIARDITEEKMAEKRIARAVFRAEEKEKKKFAETLHEGIGPLVSAIKMSMGRIRTMRKFEEKEIKIIDYCDELVDDAVTRVRNLANELMPNVINDFGLIRAITSYINKLQDQAEPEVILTVAENIPELDKESNIILYRVLTRLISNSIKFSSATTIHLELKMENTGMVINFSDNGEGFSKKATQQDKMKELDVNMESMKNRIGSLNGTVIFQNTDTGESIKILIPINQ